MKTTKLQNVINYIKYLQKVYNDEDEIFTDDSLSCDGYMLDEFSYNKKEIKQVNQKGGEGGGDYYHYVFEVNHPTYGIVHLKVEGMYDSWSGTNWSDDNMSLCELQPVTTMEYINIKDTNDEELSYEPKCER